MRTASINKRVFCIAMAVCVANIALGQLQEEWVVRYQGPGSTADYGRAVATDSAGNVYVAVSTYISAGPGGGRGYLTQKYDTNGNLLWESEFIDVFSDAQSPRDIAVDSAGNVYVSGWTTTGQAILAKMFLTIKYDTNGNLRWSRIENPQGDIGDTPSGFFLADDRSVIVTGVTVRSSGRTKFVTIKYDTNGNRLWLRVYASGSSFNVATAVTSDSAGNVYVTGVSVGDYLTIKYSSGGTLLWARRHDANGAPTSMTADSSGDLYVTGRSDNDYLTVKYDTDGNLLWERSFHGGFGRDDANAIVTDSAGFVYVTGYSRASSGDLDYATLKYGSNGTLLWTRFYDGPANGSDIAYRMAVDGAGNVYVTGSSAGVGTDLDYATVAYDTDGNLISEMRYNGPGNRTDISRAIAVDSQGNVFVTGDSNGSGTGWDVVTVKYSQVSDVVLPDSYSFFRGSQAGGVLADLFDSDDSWMTVRPGITLNQAERQVQLIVTGTAPSESPSELKFRVEAHADIPNIGQWIDLWNYDTNSYEQVDFMVATTTDSIVEVTITVDPGRFVQAGTKEMKARVSYKEVGIIFLYPWLISLDQTVWVIIP